MIDHKASLAVLLLLLALVLVGCATLQPPGATGPRGNEPVYPIVFTEDVQRREAAVAAVSQLIQPATPGEAPQLRPITATIESLPSNLGSPLYLPKLGTAAVMNEEETRESLRRFIKDWQGLIGADPAKLSLIARVDQPDGTKLASYEQRPFRYPIRGGYGKLEITFTTDRRILNISSTCIPDADRIQTVLASVSPKLGAEEAINLVRVKPITYTTATGTQSSLSLPLTAELTASGLVTYIMPSRSKPDTLEFHLGWEIDISNAAIKKLYLDAVTGDVVAVE
jgi:hypothetical protein